MAKLLTLKILDGYTRPVVAIGSGITCLMDTGADIPVWTRGSDLLGKVFTVKKIEGKKVLLSGFGKEAELVDVYIVTDVTLSDESGDKVIFRNMTVACTARPNMVANLILPATAFSHMNYTIMNKDIEAPTVIIDHDKEEYYVSPIYNQSDNRIVDKVYSFASE